MCQFYMDNTNITTHSWRDKRYRRFYEVVDSIIDELQDARPEKGGKAVKRNDKTRCYLAGKPAT